MLYLKTPLEGDETTKKFVFIFASVLTVAFGTVSVFADGTPPTSPSPSGCNSSASAGTTQHCTYYVDIRNQQYFPNTIVIETGSMIVWTNHDTVDHTVISDYGMGPNSYVLHPGQSYGYTYNSPGLFTYHCTLYPNMYGMVKVNPIQPSPTSTPTSTPQPTAPTKPPPCDCTSGGVSTGAGAITSAHLDTSTPVTSAASYDTPPTTTASTALPSTGPDTIATVTTFLTTTVVGTSLFSLRRVRQLRV